MVNNMSIYGERRIQDYILLVNLILRYEHLLKGKSDHELMRDITFEHLTTNCDFTKERLLKVINALGTEFENYNNIDKSLNGLIDIGVQGLVLVTKGSEYYGKQATSFFNKGNMRRVLCPSGELAHTPNFALNGINNVDVSNCPTYYVYDVDFNQPNNNKLIAFSSDFNIRTMPSKDMLDDCELPEQSYKEFISIISTVCNGFPTNDWINVYYYEPNQEYSVDRYDILDRGSKFNTIVSNGVLRNRSNKILTPDNQTDYDNTSCIEVSDADYVVIATMKNNGLVTKPCMMDIIIDKDWFQRCKQYASIHFKDKLEMIQRIEKIAFVPAEESIDHNDHPVVKEYTRHIYHPVFGCLPF